MIPTRTTLQAINGAMIANTNLFGDDPGHNLILIQNSFVPSPDVQLSDLTEATFPGYVAVEIPVLPQLEILDNESGRFGILLKEPVGGYKYICNAPTEPSQTIYGWAIVDGDGGLWFTELLPEPVVITDLGNFVELSAVVGYLRMDAYGNLGDE